MHAFGLPEVADGTVVLTATRHLAHLLTDAYDSAQLAAEHSVWPTATILPLQTWLATTWRNSWPAEHLLGEIDAPVARHLGTLLRRIRSGHLPELARTLATLKDLRSSSRLASAAHTPGFA